jgi:hypothetical protein
MENEDAEGPQTEDGSEAGGDYGYLLKMALYTLTEEKKKELLQQRDDKLAELKVMQTKSPASLWREDLDIFLEEVSFYKIEHFFKKNFPVHIHFMIACANQTCYCYLHRGITCVTITYIWESDMLLLLAFGNHCSQLCAFLQEMLFCFFDYAVFMVLSHLCFLEDQFSFTEVCFIMCYFYFISFSLSLS